jgi:hypothetical protein
MKMADATFVKISVSLIFVAALLPGIVVADDRPNFSGSLLADKQCAVS